MYLWEGELWSWSGDIYSKGGSVSMIVADCYLLNLCKISVSIGSKYKKEEVVEVAGELFGSKSCRFLALFVACDIAGKLLQLDYCFI